MAVRTAYVATESIGDVLTKANFDKLPGGSIGYAQVTANQTGIVQGVTTDLTNLTVTVTVNTSRRIRIYAKVDGTSGTAGDLLELLIREGSTTLQTRSFTHLSGTNYSPLETFIDLSPTAASHTYKLSLLCTGTGAATIQASATRVAFIQVDDVGPAF